jgi:ketosteroid isomerase-like protein
VSRERIRDMFEAVDARDWAAMLRCYVPDCAYERPGFPRIEGATALLNFYADVRPIAAGRHDVERVLQDGDDLCATGVFEGRLRNGEPIRLQFADLYRLKDGLIAARKTFFYAPLA